MTEKEKMLAHKMYDANYDKELMEDRRKVKELCYDFNQLRPSDEAGRQALLKRILGKTGDSFLVEPPFWCDYGYNIEIGENFYSNHNLVILDAGKVTFGDNVWFGAGVQVMPGVAIGSNVVIGRGSVVVKDIPDNSVAVGNPCRVIRPITEEDKKICWDR